MSKLKLTKLRLIFQILYTILTNGYLYGYLNGKIYKGSLKYACVPGLNCYSCPGAIGACPLGSLQGSFDNGKSSFFYAFGIVMLYAILFGIFAAYAVFGIVNYGINVASGNLEK